MYCRPPPAPPAASFPHRQLPDITDQTKLPVRLLGQANVKYEMHLLQIIFHVVRAATDVWRVQEGDLDPGAAIAMGSPVLVRLSVPLWIVNATTLPVTALVVPTEPPPKARAETDPGQPPVLNAAESIQLRIMETRTATASARCAVSRDRIQTRANRLAFPSRHRGCHLQSTTAGADGRWHCNTDPETLL